LRAFPPFQAARQGGTQTIKRGSMNRPDGRCNTISILRDANYSTGIHELAHDWLVRFLTDSEHELATAGLKEDGQTVLKWLGAEKASDLIYRDTDTKAEKAAKTKMHEKWARAYETYYREGRAPTSALKAIFERVRQWMLKIYDAAEKIGAPISDEMRGVFDRMHSLNPDKVVVAEGSKAAESFADRHEAAAAATAVKEP
jgi:hypothetical protein